jgi:predicted DNA-binding transcriptional regulator AlpA
MTLAELRARWEARAQDAEAMHATAPVADVLRVVLSELEATDGNGGPPVADRLLTAEEAAARLGVTVRWLYDHAKTLAFAKRLSRKCLRFSEAGLRRYQERRSAA